MIISNTENRPGELLAPAVADKCAGLAQQMADDMPEIDVTAQRSPPLRGSCATSWMPANNTIRFS